MDALRGRQRRWLNERGPALLAVVLLAATSAAFVRAEQQKLEPSPLNVVEVDEVISPVCGCATARAQITLELRARSRVTLTIADDEGRVVRTLIARRRPERSRVAAAWDGRDDAGRVVPDGDYRPRLRVASERRTFLLANRITVDTTRPVATVVRVEPKILTPNGDGRGDRVTISYRLSERSQPLLYVNGRLRLRGYSRKRAGELKWYGKRRGRPLRPGRYRLELAARDDAGNLGRRGRVFVVRIRRR